jgi:hypothetical protein
MFVMRIGNKEKCEKYKMFIIWISAETLTIPADLIFLNPSHRMIGYYLI